MKQWIAVFLPFSICVDKAIDRCEKQPVIVPISTFTGWHYIKTTLSITWLKNGTCEVNFCNYPFHYGINRCNNAYNSWRTLWTVGLKVVSVLVLITMGCDSSFHFEWPTFIFFHLVDDVTSYNIRVLGTSWTALCELCLKILWCSLRASLCMIEILYVPTWLTCNGRYTSFFYI